MSIRSFIPNLFTSANLFLGCLAIIEIFSEKKENVIYYTLLSGLVDFFDGFLARLLKSESVIGKDLDSLADMVSFGVVPAFVLHSMIQSNTTNEYLPLVGLVIAVMSALRLAKFNNDKRQAEVFYGLPTPANALFICTLPILLAQGYWEGFLNNPFVLCGLSVVLSGLLVMDIPLLAFKFKSFGWKGNEIKFSFLLVALILIAVYQLVALPFLIGLYLLISILTHFVANKK